jgi:hypothetical protein
MDWPEKRVMDDNVARLISECEKALAGRADGHLTLGLRRRILASFGSVDVSVNAAVLPNPAHHKRFALARSCIDKVRELWTIRFDATIVQETIGVSTETIEGRISKDDAYATWGQMWSTCDDTCIRFPDHQSDICVGYATAQLIAVALRDELCDDAVGVDDDALSPEDFDPAFLASGAFAHGFFWNPWSSSVKRREFWEWWLNEVKRIHA